MCPGYEVFLSALGEGGYEQSERIIQQLLAEAGAGGIGRDLVSVDPRGAEVAADWGNLKSPENYVGYERTENFASRGGAVLDKPHVYAAPAKLKLNQWALSGDWTVEKQVIVLNKAGATGNIASETVAKAKPDGYTISITPASSTMAAAPYLYKKLPFDPIKDFTPVTTLASLPFVLIVDAKKPIHSVADLVKHLKGRDGGFYGGSNNTGIVAAELFKDATKTDTKRVAYKNIADSVTT